MTSALAHGQDSRTGKKGMEVGAKYRDPLCRFTPTPHTADLRVMDRTVRLETNSPTVLGQTVRLFERYQAPPLSRAEFLWRIVGENRSGLKPPWPEMTAFSDDALRYVNLGQQNFFAVDLEAREAVAFLSEDLAVDDLGFSSVFLATLFDLTAAALRLTQIPAACVARDSKAVLIFGPPTSGKTSSTYLAGKLGLEFHADQVTFLELKPDGVHAWGQFWPAAFREDTSQFLPELASATRPFAYGTLTFRCFERHPFQRPEARSVVPVCCAFLERRPGAAPRLGRLPSTEFDERLRRSLCFREDERFDAQRTETLRALAKLPAYRLTYGEPRAAAGLYLDLVGARSLPEVAP
jgi:hypothetical protein